MATSTPRRLLEVSGVIKNFIRNKFNDAHAPRTEPIENYFNNEKHIYKQNSTKDEIIDYLAENVVYKTDDLIVTNKPYGLGKERSSTKLVNYIPHTFEDVYLKEILPKLAERLECKSLQIVKTPERFASGVLILSSTEAGTMEISNGIKKAKKRNSLFMSYITVTVGHPTQDKLESNFGIQSVTKNDAKFPVIVEKWSKNNVLRGLTKTFKWKHSVISKSELASLVKVELSNNRKNCLKLSFATKCFSPVLGDHLFNGRVLDLFGVPLLLDPATTPDTSATLHPKLMTALQLDSNELKIIPSHVHLKSLTLPLKNNLEFSVSVPPPKWFAWTCEQLGLNLDK